MDPGSTVPDLIAAQAGRNPDRVALVMGSERLTYAELELRAAQLAGHLLSLGAGPDVPVALCLERSPRFVVAALAIMKCGAAYLPIDPAHPRDRLRFIVEDARAPIVVTQASLAGHFAGLSLKIVDIDAEKAVIDRQTARLTGTRLAFFGLVYVIYTSGSSGRPKGVEVTHANLSNLVSWHIRAFGLNHLDRSTFQAGVGFDAAVWEIWPSLAVGASLHLPDEATRISADSLRDWLLLHRITVTFVPTVMAGLLIALPWPADAPLRFLLTGADTLHRYPPPGLPFSLVNNYGPTECAVVATSGVVAPN